MAPAKYISGLTRLVLEPFPYRAPLVKNRLEGFGILVRLVRFCSCGKMAGFFPMERGGEELAHIHP